MKWLLILVTVLLVIEIQFRPRFGHTKDKILLWYNSKEGRKYIILI